MSQGNARERLLSRSSLKNIQKKLEDKFDERFVFSDEITFNRNSKVNNHNARI